MNLANEIKAYSKHIKYNYGGTCIPTDEEGYINFNIVFVNSDGIEDETQMDVRPADFDYGAGKCSALVELWNDFCEENGFNKNSVMYICIPGLD